jgi:tetratricopeptide (TPR) repeat protein
MALVWAAAALGSLLLSSAPAAAKSSHGGAGQTITLTAADAATASALAGQVAQAINERRFVDAQSLLDQAVVTGVSSPTLTVLRGDLFLNRGRYSEALETYKTLIADPVLRPRALQGEGLAFSLLNRSEEALAALREATTLDKTLWMAWNGLGREYDLRRSWANAKTAYAAALAAPGVNMAIVLNNRGYSEMLQTQIDAAATDFVAALERDPALTAARTNLRIALAMEGHYSRAAVTGVGDDRAAVLNNVGVAAAMRGDYLQADRLLNEAMAAKGQYYARAAENLQLSHSLADRQDDLSTGHDAAH